MAANPNTAPTIVLATGGTAGHVFPADALANAGIDKAPRGKEKASDHTPVWCEMEI